MVRIARNLAKRGAAAEADFKAWLDDSRLPYIYATQDRESVPAYWRGQLKRPDYMVAMPYMGIVAFDVKSKTIYEGGYWFDDAEIRGLALFSELFCVSTFFACMDPGGSWNSHWFRLQELTHLPRRKVKGRLVTIVPTDAGIAVDMTKPFQDAIRAAVTLR